MGLALLAVVVTPTGVAAVAAAVSAVAVVVLIARPPRAEGLAWLVAITLVLSDVPLWRTLVDVPPEPPPRFAGGRVYERAAAEPHPMPHAPDWPPAEPETRAIFRRATRELWALTGALGGMPYAFDGDPDGIYFEGDRVVGKAIDALPWADRAPAAARGRRRLRRRAHQSCRHRTSAMTELGPETRRRRSIGWRGRRPRCAWPRASSPP